MTSIVTDFKSIARKLNRQEQKAEFEAKNPKVEPSMYGWPYGVAVPFEGMPSGGMSTPIADAESLPPYTPSCAADRNGPVPGKLIGTWNIKI